MLETSGFFHVDVMFQLPQRIWKESKIFTASCEGSRVAEFSYLKTALESCAAVYKTMYGMQKFVAEQRGHEK
jgi:hypothetical protein